MPSLLELAILLLAFTAGPSLQAPCTNYGFDCFIAKERVNTTLSCANFRHNKLLKQVKGSSSIKCDVFSTYHDLVLSLEYKDIEFTPIIDYVDPSLGVIVNFHDINRLILNLYVRSYVHSFTTQFPRTFSGLTINVAKTRCIDFAAFAWTSLENANQIELLRSLKPQWPQLVSNSTMTENNPNNRTHFKIRCFKGKLIGDIDLDGDCLLKTRFTSGKKRIGGSEKSFDFFVRVHRSVCRHICTATRSEGADTEFRVVSKKSLVSCTTFQQVAENRSQLVNALLFGLGSLVFLLCVLTYFLLKRNQCPCCDGRWTNGPYMQAEVKT